MKERPILFSTPMVQAILAGRKTQTRRVCKHQSWSFSELHDVNSNGIIQKVDRSVSCPYGQVGDLLWVRETHTVCGVDFSENEIAVSYKADDKILYHHITETVKKHKIKIMKPRPSIFLPKSFSRIWLKITDIRVDILENISNYDAKCEGIKYSMSLMGFCGYDYLTGGYNYMTTPRNSFLSLWRFVNKIDRYASTGNPWVWVIKFEVISTTGKPEAL